MMSNDRKVLSSFPVVLAGLVASLIFPMSGYVGAADGDTANDVLVSLDSSQQLYAKVGDAVITVDEFNQSFQRTVRQKFYHSKPPEGELDIVRKSVADELIMRQLLLQEAKNRGLQPDVDEISKTLDQYDKRYANSSRWKEQKDVLLKTLRKKLSDEDILQQLQNSVRNIVPPTDRQLKKYYQDNHQKFTEPMQQKLSLILLAVDPSSPKEVWDAAMKQGETLVDEIKSGADFSGLARMHSADVSAGNGGDMGYVHREMLSEAAQKVIDELEVGEISNAVRVLQGIAILRLENRKPEQLRKFSDVAERARGLWLRDKSEEAWMFLKEKLKLDTPITVYNNIHTKDSV